MRSEKSSLHSSLVTHHASLLTLGLFLIVLGLLANEWLLTALLSADGELSPRSVVIIWLFDGVVIIIGLALALSRSWETLLNVLVGVVITALLLYGGEWLFYALNHPQPAPRVWHEGDYTQDFFRPDDLLGYTVRPAAQIRSIKKQAEGDAPPTIIYDVVYSIDEYHRRLTPVDPAPQQRDKFLLFFGDSFTFGEGLADNETLPYHVGQLAPAYRPYNYGLSGYGPQQMLAKLQSDDLRREIPEKEGVAIYTFIDGHVERALGSMYVYNTWGDQMPYYTLDGQGNLVRRGNFTTGRPLLSTLYSLLGHSEIARYYNVNIPPRLQDRHYAFAARVIAAARDTFTAKYHSDDFYVLIYPDEGDYFEDLQPHFEAFGLNILNYDERLKLNPDEGLAIVGDGHPTGKTHHIVAGWITEDLDIGSQ